MGRGRRRVCEAPRPDGGERAVGVEPPPTEVQVGSARAGIVPAPPSPQSTALERSFPPKVCGERAGRASRMSRPTPVTNGAAMLVPVFAP